MSPEDDPTISVGRSEAVETQGAKPEDDGEGRGHPLPASEKARHGSIPESVEQARGHGAN